MNAENIVRVHLKQAILVGYGEEEARYAKVLIGEEQVTPTRAHHNDIFILVTVIGYVRGYQGHNLAEPTKMLLSTSNILSIEYAKIEPTRYFSGKIDNVRIYLCGLYRAHAPHTYRGTGPMVDCPGKGY